MKIRSDERDTTEARRKITTGMRMEEGEDVCQQDAVFRCRSGMVYFSCVLVVVLLLLLRCWSVGTRRYEREKDF